MSSGLSKQGLVQFRAVAERYVGDTLVPGLVALVAHGGEVHVEALGSLTIGGASVTRSSLFRIASTTKPITAAATLALVTEGRIGLDEPIDRLIPELADRHVLLHMDGALGDTAPALRSITTRDLLTFTFGFGASMGMFGTRSPWPIVKAANELGLATLGPPDPDVQPDPDTWIERLGSLPLLAQPGERWLYNTGASVLGVLLARAAGMSLGDVFRTRIFEPLAMRDTSFWTPEVDRLATAYQPTPAGLVVWDEPQGRWGHEAAFSDGAAGLVSTVDDLYAFARMLMLRGEAVLPSNAVEQMTSDQLTATQKALGGLGPDFFVGRSWGFCIAVHENGSFGWDGGLGTSWHVDPVRDLIVVVLTQRMFESPQKPAVHRDLHAAAYAALEDRGHR